MKATMYREFFYLKRDHICLLFIHIFSSHILDKVRKTDVKIYKAFKFESINK